MKREKKQKEKKEKKAKKEKKPGKVREKKPEAEKKGKRFSLPVKLPGRSAKEEHPAENVIVFGADAAETAAPVPAFAPEGDGFIAGVRSAEPVLVVDDSTSGKEWLKDLPMNIAGAFLVLAFLSLFCMVTDSYELIPFLIPGSLLFAGLTIFGSLKPGRLRWIVSGVTGALLIAAVIIFHGAILGGLAEQINMFYDTAEEAQAYLYNRISWGGSDGGNPSVAAVWLSCLIGLIVSLPPAKYRQPALVLVAVIAMFAFAYYGLVPSWVIIAVFLAALLAGLSKGNVISALIMILAVMLIYGLIVLIDPGENYTISRIDENFRDKFALSSSLIERGDQDTTDMSGLDDLSDPDYEDEFEDDEMLDLPKHYIAIGIALLIVAALAAAAFVMWKRLDRRRKALQAGIDSSDPREAVTAMFPYSVRWLKAGGVETEAKPFWGLGPLVEGSFSKDYADRYNDMYLLWREAAYSEHEINENDRTSMESFLKDTTGMVKDKLSFGDKIRTLFKYSLL